MSIVKLKPGEVVIVSAGDPNKPDQGLPTPQPPTGPVDPGYGIDLGLGWLRPSHPIASPGQPDNTLPPIELPPTGPVDPSWGIDEDIGYERPTNPIASPGQPDNTLPEVQPPSEGVGSDVEWEIKTAWTPVSGWIVVAVPVGGNVPTPSKRK
jgi:hypothetical protein